MRTISGKARTVLFAMLGLGMMTLLSAYSPVLYRTFCQATGLNGTTNRALTAPGATDHKVVVQFDSNVAPNMPWRFRPESRSDTVDIGARDMAFFLATNTSDHPITGTASYNVTPAIAGKYFTKIQCFCFTQQTLKPGETARMPVIFFVDPKILDDPDTRDVQAITLSYTFFPAGGGTSGRAAPEG